MIETDISALALFIRHIGIDKTGDVKNATVLMRINEHLLRMVLTIKSCDGRDGGAGSGSPGACG